MSASRTVLLTGHGGFLGHYLQAALGRRGVRVITAGRGRADIALDLARPDEVGAVVRAAAPDAVLHCAALSSVGACERDPELAQRVNTESVAALAACGVRLLQVSTDLVFGGDAAPYVTADPPAPRSVYGASKAAAEAAVLAAPDGLVVRVPLLFGRSFDGRRGATDMIRGAGGPGVLTLFTNEHRTPLHAADAASALVDLLLDTPRGIVQVAGAERVSRWELAERFAAAAGTASLEFVAAGECDDPQRPRDVSLVSDVVVGRGLDAALAVS